MSQTTITLLFLAFAIISFILEKIPLGLTATIVGALGASPSPILLLLVIFIVGCALTNFMSNTATTALMVPIATSLARSLVSDPPATIIAAVISCAFAHSTLMIRPANTMVVGLGGYKFKDYVKAGLPLIAISFALCMVLLPILFPFYP